MQTEDFTRHLETLIRLATRSRTAAMCAEAVPWRCHRSLVSDALVIRDADVLHIMGPAPPTPHVLTAWARRDGVRPTYPPAHGELRLT
jgi:uncharacterized protein (DUF488 family)